MIAGIFHNGSGLGNQLHRYVMTRTLALDKGTDFGMVYPHQFKGKDFMKLDMGKEVPDYGLHHFEERRTVNEYGDDIRYYDWLGINMLSDDTLIDGEFQGEEYYQHHMKEIDEWLKVEPIDMPEDLCVIGFRGGEYVGVPGLFLPDDYWSLAIEIMQDKYPGIRFEVHTDDPETASKFFPDFVCIHDRGLNWRSVRYAKHLIIANSSFYILPSLLNKEVKEVIAPKYWAGYNKGFWQLQQNVYKKFQYLHHEHI
jgi:hypothetical protein